MVLEAERRARVKPRSKPDEVEQLKQLIAIQTQIVELAKQNELTKRECETLRRELAGQVRRGRGVRGAIGNSARRFRDWLKIFRKSDA
jgi:hypothetical protein